MNERIFELAERAGFKLIRENCYDVVSTMSVQEFAELIVRECLEKIYSVTIDNPTDDWDQGYNSGLDQAAETIKTHFGVEE